MAEAALIDLSHLNLYVGGDIGLRDEILTIFEENSARWIAALDPSAPDDQWRLAAHTLKGAARGVGAWTVGEVCADAEKLIGDPQKRADRTDVLVKLRTILSETMDELRALRDRAEA